MAHTDSNSAHDTADSFSSFVDSLMGDTVVVAGDAPKALPLPTAEQHAYAERKASYGGTYPKPKATMGKTERAATWRESHPAEYAFLMEARGWSDFAGKMLEQSAKVIGLNANQLGAVHSMMAKCAARAEAMAASRAAKAPAGQAVDMGTIKAIFDAAFASGVKRPMFRANGLTLSRAPDTGRNAGAIYVKDALNVYKGKVMNGKFYAVRGQEVAISFMEAIARDPKAAAIEHGKRTGKCSCCGRTLTDPDSIALGIGPICAGKWSL